MNYRIRALKYGDVPHYEWDAQALKTCSDYLLAKSVQGRTLTHHTKKKAFVMDHFALELFSLKDGYTVSFAVRNGRMTSIYCNVALPSVIGGNVLTFVDLDLDLLFDGESWSVVDEDEFEANQRKYGYPEPIVAGALASLRDLQLRVRERLFPFGGELDEYLNDLIRESLSLGLETS